MVNKRPLITREGTVVHIDCFDEKAADECHKQINKIINNRVLQMMVLRKIKR